MSDYVSTPDTTVIDEDEYDLDEKLDHYDDCNGAVNANNMDVRKPTSSRF